MDKEIKYPFEPNEKVKAAFRQESRMRRTVQLMTEALLIASQDVIDPWLVLKEEHPEVANSKEVHLRYISVSELVDIDYRKKKQ